MSNGQLPPKIVPIFSSLFQEGQFVFTYTTHLLATPLTLQTFVVRFTGGNNYFTFPPNTPNSIHKHFFWKFNPLHPSLKKIMLNFVK